MIPSFIVAAAAAPPRHRAPPRRVVVPDDDVLAPSAASVSFRYPASLPASINPALPVPERPRRAGPCRPWGWGQVGEEDGPHALGLDDGPDDREAVASSARLNRRPRVVGRGSISLPTPKQATAKKCITSTEGRGRRPERREIGPVGIPPAQRQVVEARVAHRAVRLVGFPPPGPPSAWARRTPHTGRWPGC